MEMTQYENYFVNQQGDVFSTKFNKVRKLKPVTTKWGYLQVSICNNNKIKAMSVHRLVAQTFIPNPQKKPEVNHINGIKSDNRVDNLQWVTPKENMDHAILNGLMNSSIGENHHRVKLTEQQVLEIRQLYPTRKYTIRELAKIFNISHSQISDIVNKKYWKHI